MTLFLLIAFTGTFALGALTGLVVGAFMAAPRAEASDLFPTDDDLNPYSLREDQS